jgi:hypothetical protein
MKQIVLFVFYLFFIGSSCRKHKAVDPVSQLPPETQTGANTFGCLVNGQVFKPGGAQLSGGSLQCNYQFVNGGYYFVLSGRNQTGGNPLTSVNVYTDSLSISTDLKLNLITRKDGNASGRYFGSQTNVNLATYLTKDSQYTGELWIKKLDTINQIASGIFWFNAVNENGDTI